ncbi:sn-glycerol-3-phosphate import ATP-binding protein UgpC [Janthinobacterium sp. HH103]|jgi:multiple sugar transport system ATP-binding protein|uniref:sn-glycerol-3-phosphate ABC transporter ATP-binding protein UgpC n=1 Tax=Janthinobacterium agaricidamnosum TaxID=55508 RepID=A0A3G2E968_9BURK|nr:MULTISPECIES: sn-glycerol-3-phosphate ABC transporter ATP-binding protein UgpC [Janthinobacterium]AYM76039.1 sn-glycerol-3-phosphate ABC transporter ATP-binding protein UgpC [Janthinobacterium agaricidamnosum]MCC7682499.1 sn-glycerol-3-phosphate ABC transporter ATP-binding protein UgpC [Janthinobacterium sp. FW305-128]OEZ70553.1 sn-glycerol-3-phosphate import ATP-binding protein UgpC [Janthinobacterium sp. HH100]OEZ87884.1 sn-glycerol-3-phosphate import ATP-binding protein UgpC [Janthinobact
MSSLSIRSIRKVYTNGVEVLKGIDIEIKDGQFLILVGGSGSGKSTLLNMVAGLESVTSGEILIDGKVVNDLPPKDRDIAMVFQSYALYPSMTVRENIAFGLNVKKVPKAEQEEIVSRVAETLQITHLLDRRPAQLSGGQRQRVAMGRAISRKPSLFLFDEPLSNLDAKLRVEMRAEIKLLHQRLKATIVYVTHDQIEAMTMGDLIAVMKDGVVQQLGTPQEIYDNPANLFVAGFIGSPSMNFITVKPVIEGNDVFVAIENAGKSMRLALPFAADKLRSYAGRDVILGVRPEQITDMSSAHGDVGQELGCLIDLVEPTGPDTLLTTRLNGAAVTCRTHPREAVLPGQTMQLSFNLSKAALFDPANGERIA